MESKFSDKKLWCHKKVGGIENIRERKFSLKKLGGSQVFLKKTLWNLSFLVQIFINPQVFYRKLCRYKFVYRKICGSKLVYKNLGGTQVFV